MKWSKIQQQKKNEFPIIKWRLKMISGARARSQQPTYVE